MKKNANNVVLVVRCEDYDRDRIEEIVTAGMKRLGYRPKGKVFVKPNVVFAYDTKKFGDSTYTEPQFVGASLLALSKQPGVKRVDMGEKTAVGFPTRLCFKQAGYYDQLKEVRKKASCPVTMFAMEEERRDSVFLGGKVHDNLRVPRTMHRADTKVYLPKLKCHCVCNMTGAVKLNIGICSDDERSIRHDFMLNEKIVDLLQVGYPDFTIMDAIDVGVGNEAFPTRRKLGLILMSTNPLALDLVAARLLGYNRDDVPYLRDAVKRGYTPSRIEEVIIDGDLKSIKDIDKQAKRLLPYDDEYYNWQDVSKELVRLKSPMRFYWGPYNAGTGEKCRYGCVMGIKMFLGAMEKYGGPEAFRRAKAVSFVIGKYDKTIDAKGEEVFLLGSCAGADIVNAKKVVHIDKCFTTAADMNMAIGPRLGMPTVMRDPRFLLTLLGAMNQASFKKFVNLRYLQDIGHFISKGLLKRL